MGDLPIYGFQVIKKKKEVLVLKNKRFKGKKLNPNPFSLMFCSGCKWVLVLIWIGLEECIGFQRKCYQNFVKTHVLVLAID